MVLATYVQAGDAIDFTPTVDVAAGSVIVVGELIGVTKRDIKANELGAIAVAGVFDVAKQGGAGVTFAIGAKVYWDDTNNVAVVTDGAGANKPMGKAVLVAADAATTVRVRISQ